MASSSRRTSPEPHATSDFNDNCAPKYGSIDEVLEDLSSRFILNLPDNQLASVERICFQVEQAHWFYEDFIRESQPQFPSLPLKKFSEMLFRACPLIKHWSADHEQAFEHFMLYKTRVPVCGAIMLNAACDKCVLVKGWKSSSGWGFPKGKINQDELPYKCAIREVLEETGYDLTKQINPDDVIVVTIKEQRISLFIVPGVPEDFPFQTRTRKEISKIEWFKLVDLPTWKRNKTVPGKFYLISPFIGPLRTFVNERKSGRHGKSQTREPRQHGHRTRSSQAFGSVDASASRSNVQDTTSVSDALDIGSLDPHMARLLNGLTLSAQNQDARSAGNQHSPAVMAKVPVDRGPSRPMSTDPSTSSASPSPYMDNSSVTSFESTPSTNGHHSETGSIGRLQGPLVISTNGVGPGISPIATPRSAALSSAWTTASNSSGPGSLSLPPRSIPSRQGTSSVGDISPYLSHPTEIPSSGKRLKQLALLESVVDESARQAAITRANTAMGMNGPLMQPPVTSASVPLSPADSLAPVSQIGYAEPRQPYVGHSPAMPRALPATAPIHPTSLLHQVAHDDPFTVRPRPATAMRDSAYPSGSMQRNSMQESHLLSIIPNAPMLDEPTPRPLQAAGFPGVTGMNSTHGNKPMSSPMMSFSGAVPPPQVLPPNVPYMQSPGPFAPSGPVPHPVYPRPFGYPPPPAIVPMLPVRAPFPPAGASSTATANLLSILNNTSSSVNHTPITPSPNVP